MFEFELTYVYRTTELEPNSFQHEYYVNINSESSSQLHATPEYLTLPSRVHSPASAHLALDITIMVTPRIVVRALSSISPNLLTGSQRTRDQFWAARRLSCSSCLHCLL